MTCSTAATACASSKASSAAACVASSADCASAASNPGVSAGSPSWCSAAFGRVEIVMAFEEEFSFQIPDNEAEKIDSIKSAVDFIASHPQAKLWQLGYKGGRKTTIQTEAGKRNGNTILTSWVDAEVAAEAGTADLVGGALAEQQLQPKAREGQWHR
ncbi:hypothetical protein ZWY2020_008462 [Hordeum vulgare]|nr:hypothetical protein ZWY2020_008462 [Hordeum vulgare]